MSKTGPPPRPGVGGDRPSPRRPRLWVGTFSPQGTHPTRLIALNDWIHGFWTHYLVSDNRKDDRTRPCVRDAAPCPLCSSIKNRRWKGYLGVHVVGAKRPMILEITEGAWDGTPDLRRLDGELRGWQWTVRREFDRPRSRLLMERALAVHSRAAFPKVDVLAVLARMWATTVEDLAALAGVEDGAGGWGNAAGLTPELLAQVEAPETDGKEEKPATLQELHDFVQRAKAKLHQRDPMPQ